jgi:hypothetical protein
LRFRSGLDRRQGLSVPSGTPLSRHFPHPLSARLTLRIARRSLGRSCPCRFRLSGKNRFCAFEGGEETGSGAGEQRRGPVIFRRGPAGPLCIAKQNNRPPSVLRFASAARALPARCPPPRLR